MVIDTSAIIAILTGEKEAESFAKAIASDNRRLVSAFTVLETSIVIESKKGERGACEFTLFLKRSHVEIIAMNNEQAVIALNAWRSYGKGRHKAGLNIGDCCSYALAKHFDEPLLFKGNDFSQTDVKAVFCNFSEEKSLDVLSNEINME